MIIFGFRSKVAVLGTFRTVCGVCGNEAAQRIVRVRRFFTLFFIPLIPISNKYVQSCTYCGQGTKLTSEQVEQIVSLHAVGGSTAIPASAEVRAQEAADKD